MAGKWCTEGLNRMLNILFEATAVDATLYLGLYTDTTEPVVGASLSDLSELPVANGYARLELARGADWTIVAALATAGVETFTSAGGDWGNVYGYFVGSSSDDSGDLMFVEHFSDGPYNNIDGGSILVQCRITGAQNMPREFLDGFENGSANLWNTVYMVDADSFVSRIADAPDEQPTGMSGYYLYLDGTDYIYRALTARAEYYFSFLYSPRYSNTYAESLIGFYSDTTLLGWIWRNTTSPYVARICVGNTSTITSTGTAELLLDNTYLIEVYFKIAQSGGRFVVKINGVTDIDYTGDTFGSLATMNRVQLGRTYSTSYTAYACYDNFVCDSEGWIGSANIIGLVPTAKGNSTEWVASTGKNYACVDEIPVSDADYLRAAAVDKVDTYTLEDLSIANFEAIKCVQVQCRAGLSGVPTPTNINLAIHNGGTDYFSDDIAIPAAFGPLTNIWEADPKYTESDLVTNGGFPANVADWASFSSLGTYASVAGGQAGNCLEITEAGVANPDFYQAVTTVIGHRYIITLYVKEGTEATWNARVNGTNLGDIYLNPSEATGDEATAAWVQHTLTFTALDTTTNIILQQIAATPTGTTLLFDTITLTHTPLWHLTEINALEIGVKSKA